jgi:hypothetical protein
LIDGTPFRRVHAETAPPYAASAPWYRNGRPVVHGGDVYYQNGLTRELSAHELERVGEFEKVPLFGLADPSSDEEGLLFVPVRPGCMFQPYNRFIASPAREP